MMPGTRLLAFARRWFPPSTVSSVFEPLVADSFWLLMSFVLVIPFMREGAPLDLVWLVLPGCLTLMLPFAILPAIDGIRRDGEVPTLRERRAVITVAAIAVCGVVIGQGWLAPVANQSFRNQVASRIGGRPVGVPRCRARAAVPGAWFRPAARPRLDCAHHAHGHRVASTGRVLKTKRRV